VRGVCDLRQEEKIIAAEAVGGPELAFVVLVAPLD
jgi:hypothetical protein